MSALVLTEPWGVYRGGLPGKVYQRRDQPSLWLYSGEDFSRTRW